VNALDQLRQALAAVPPEALVPAGWVLDRLGDRTPSPAESAPELLTVRQLAELLHRSRSTVRAWCERGEFAGAVKVQDRAWLVPRVAVDGFLERQRGSGRSTDAPVADRSHGRADLGAWRRLRWPKDGTA